MKTSVIPLFASIMLTLGSLNPAAAATLTLPYRVEVTPEIKRMFRGSDFIELRAITGTAPRFQVGGTYRVVGICRQETIQSGTLYIGNTAEPGSAAITAVRGSSLAKVCGSGLTEFDVTFRLLRPGILHVTVYDMAGSDKNDNAYAGLYLGDVVLPHECRSTATQVDRVVPNAMGA